jgi:hypothetical protein
MLEITQMRKQYAGLVKQKEESDNENTELEIELEFWKQKNEKASLVLHGSMKELQSLYGVKDSEVIKLMEELSSIYTRLDGAAQRLRVRPK